MRNAEKQLAPDLRCLKRIGDVIQIQGGWDATVVKNVAWSGKAYAWFHKHRIGVIWSPLDLPNHDSGLIRKGVSFVIDVKDHPYSASPFWISRRDLESERQMKEFAHTVGSVVLDAVHHESTERDDGKIEDDSKFIAPKNESTSEPDNPYEA